MQWSDKNLPKKPTFKELSPHPMSSTGSSTQHPLDMGGWDNSLKVGFLGRFLSDYCITKVLPTFNPG